MASLVWDYRWLPRGSDLSPEPIHVPCKRSAVKQQLCSVYLLHKDLALLHVTVAGF